MTQFAMQRFVGAELGLTMVLRPPDPAGVGEIAVEDAALAPRKPEDENGRMLNNSGITTRREMRGVVIVTESLPAAGEGA